MLPREASRAPMPRRLVKQSTTAMHVFRLSQHHDYAVAYSQKLKVSAEQIATLRTLRTMATLERRLEEQQRRADALVASGAVIVEEDPDAASSSQFWQQGDLSLHTRHVLEQRFALRHHPAVTAVLHTIWLAALRSVQSGDRDGSTPSTELHEEGYGRMFRRVYRVMLEEWDPEDAASTIAEDWLNDARGEAGLPRVGFYDALFEVLFARRGHSNPRLSIPQLARTA